MVNLAVLRGSEKGTLVEIALTSNAEKRFDKLVDIDYFSEDASNKTNIPGRHVVGYYMGEPHRTFVDCIPLAYGWNFEIGEPDSDFPTVHIDPSVIAYCDILSD